MVNLFFNNKKTGIHRHIFAFFHMFGVFKMIVSALLRKNKNSRQIVYIRIVRV